MKGKIDEQLECMLSLNRRGQKARSNIRVAASMAHEYTAV